ncbi:hypothetical protein BGW80DRAFT_1346716 [Lactifluus volemus]|nr:hypothetical protein BGW80DRAFT_1346716 [Lactifluus volemus]
MISGRGRGVLLTQVGAPCASRTVYVVPCSFIHVLFPGFLMVWLTQAHLVQLSQSGGERFSRSWWEFKDGSQAGDKGITSASHFFSGIPQHFHTTTRSLNIVSDSR